MRFGPVRCGLVQLPDEPQPSPRSCDPSASPRPNAITLKAAHRGRIDHPHERRPGLEVRLEARSRARLERDEQVARA